MQVGGIAAGILLVLAAATLGVRIGARVWRDPAYAEKMIQAGRVLPFGYATSRGMTRGTLPLWTGIGFIGVGTLLVATLPAGPVPPASTRAVIAGVCYALGLAALGLTVAIVWFNRPRLVVPPHMRGEDGLVAAWWRCRNLPPARRRAAARERRRWPALGHPRPARSGRARTVPAPGGSVIRLSRAAAGRRDKLRRYQVIIDGEQTAMIKRGQRLDLPVLPGQHTVFLQIDWARSPQLEVDAPPGEVISLECAPGNAEPFGAGADAYIDLRRSS